jgi:hypothetical protein
MENRSEPRKEPVDMQSEGHANLYPSDTPRQLNQSRSTQGGVSKNYLAIITVMLLLLNAGASYFITTSFAPSITSVDVIAGMVNQHEATINAENTGLSARLENVINSLGNYAKKAELSAYALNSQLSGLISAEELNVKIAELKSLLETDIKAAEDAIKSLEDIVSQIQAGNTGDTTDGLDASIQVQFGQYVVLPHGSTSEVLVPLRLIIENTTSANLKDIRLTVYFETNSYVVLLDWATGYPVLSGGTTSWVVPYSNVFAFQNGWGLNVNANSTVTINLMLGIKLNTALTTDIAFSPVVIVE